MTSAVGDGFDPLREEQGTRRTRARGSTPSPKEGRELSKQNPPGSSWIEKIDCSKHASKIQSSSTPAPGDAWKRRTRSGARSRTGSWRAPRRSCCSAARCSRCSRWCGATCFGQSFEWQQDAVTLFILSAVFLYFGISQRRGAHLNVNLLIRRAGNARAAHAARGRVHQGARHGHLVPVHARRGVVGHPGSRGQPGNTAAAAKASRSRCGRSCAALLVGFAFMAVSLFFQIYRGVQGLRGRKVLDEPSRKANAALMRRAQPGRADGCRSSGSSCSCCSCSACRSASR